MNVTTLSQTRPATNVERKLHLGCFDRPVDGWVNTDITPHLFVAKVPFLAAVMHKLGRMNDIRYRQHKQGIFKKLRYLNATKPLPFSSESFDCVYSSHMLEHLPRNIVPRLLNEIYRVLKPGGVVRTVVPDLDYFINHYDALDSDTFVNGVFENNHSTPRIVITGCTTAIRCRGCCPNTTSWMCKCAIFNRENARISISWTIAPSTRSMSKPPSPKATTRSITVRLKPRANTFAA